MSATDHTEVAAYNVPQWTWIKIIRNPPSNLKNIYFYLPSKKSHLLIETSQVDALKK